MRQDLDRDALRGLAEACTGEGSLCHYHPFEVTATKLEAALLVADATGRERKQAFGLDMSWMEA